MQRLTLDAWRELIRRGAALLLFHGGAVLWLGHGLPGWATVCATAGLALYALLPRPCPPRGALFAERMPSVWMPDLVTLILTLPFLAGPFVIAAREEWLGGPWALMLFLWPPGLIALVIAWVATRHQCGWVVLHRDAVDLRSVYGTTHLPFDAIASVRPVERGLPRWVPAALTAFGGVRGAGIALLHGDRKSHAAVIALRGGDDIHVPLDAFPQMDRVLRAMLKAGVPVAGLVTPRRSKRKKNAREGQG
jgi:hypothetical protein